MSGHPRQRAIALLSWAIERRLSGGSSAPLEETHVDPWDVWWACARSDLMAPALGLDGLLDQAGCARCSHDVRWLTSQLPVPRIDPDAWRCECAGTWARALRSSPSPAAWAPWRVVVAVIKPGTNVAKVQHLLADHYIVLGERECWLDAEDAKRLYADSYGGPFRARQALFLTSEPVRVLTLLAPTAFTGQQHYAIKHIIRRQLGVGDDLRNHLHMSDNPGEAWCDVMHLAGATVAQQLYERYERDRSASNMAVYRDLLAWRSPVADPHRA